MQFSVPWTRQRGIKSLGSKVYTEAGQCDETVAVPHGTPWVSSLAAELTILHRSPGCSTPDEVMGRPRAPALVSLATGRMRARSCFLLKAPLSQTPTLPTAVFMLPSRTLGLAFWVPQDYASFLQRKEGAPPICAKICPRPR